MIILCSLNVNSCWMYFCWINESLRLTWQSSWSPFFPVRMSSEQGALLIKVRSSHSSKYSLTCSNLNKLVNPNRFMLLFYLNYQHFLHGFKVWWDKIVSLQFKICTCANVSLDEWTHEKFVDVLVYKNPVNDLMRQRHCSIIIIIQKSLTNIQ